jgi:hypothetical protein
MGDQVKQHYDFGDEDGWTGEVEAPSATVVEPQEPAQEVRKYKRRTILIGLGATAGGLAIGGFAGYKLLGNLFRPNYFSLNGSVTTPKDIVVYTNGKLETTWQDWSWTPRQFTSRAELYQNQPSIQMTLDTWGALYLHYLKGPIDLTDFGYLQFYVNGGAGSDQKVTAFFAKANNGYTTKTLIGPYTEGGSVSSHTWKLTRIPLKAMQATNLMVSGLLLEDDSGAHQPDISIADLRLVYAPDLSPPHIMQSVAFDLSTITLVFDKRMLPDDAQGTHFYNIFGPDSIYTSGKEPKSAHYHASSQSVSLLLPVSMSAGSAYTVNVGAVRDKYGVTLANPSVAHVTPQALTLSIDASQNQHPISELIYGMAQLQGSALNDLRPRINRWGGNQTTRYNWKLGNAFSAARDYEFRNGNYNHTSPADKQPSGVADQFIAGNVASGIPTILTIPNIGWVARDDQLSTRSTGVPQTGGPPLSPGSDAIEGYNPAANRQVTCVPSLARKNAPLSDPPDVTDPTVAQDEWVYHLTKRFGQASNGGVRYYAMDNEPDLWFATHTDIKPAELSYEQMRDTFLDYATAVKSVDPTAMVTGPVLSGWQSYFYSPLDRGSDNFRTKPDYHAHNDQAFLPWWLAQVRAYDERAGQRSLDYLDIHYYPSGGEYSANIDPQMNAQRLQAVRSLWDAAYTDKSWINANIQLIPRMKTWIQQNYPGTKLAITEWNFGAENHINGALAAAEALGVFGREGLDMACYWANPSPGTPAYSAWKLYTNYDSQGSFFGGTSVQAISSNYDMLSCYAAQDASGVLLVMVLNKSPIADLTPTIQLANVQANGAQVYQVSEDTPNLTRLADITLPGQAFSMTFPASSITLLRITQ